jgi:Uma2 family endonuclease
MDRDHHVGRLMTLEEYLAFEERSTVKHEYVAGEAYAMPGVTTRHNLITLNLARHLHVTARARGCYVFATDVKLKVADRVYYPDVMVACGRAASVELIVEEPSLIVEVTSPSTRATDRREKLDAYRRIPSLGAYLIVDQRRRHVLAYLRAAAGEWSKQELSGTEELPLPALETRITLDEIYEGIELPPLAVGEAEPWEEYGEPDAW